MGLDVVVYTDLKKIDPAKYEDQQQDGDDFFEFCWDQEWRLFNTECFPEHAGDIENYVPYNRGDDTFSFRAGSYGSYNGWRNQLAQLAGYGSAENVWEMEHPWGKPFIELINFSDCEGVIGFKLCEKLAEDFVRFHARAIAFAEDNGYDHFMYTYDNFLEGFTRASENHGIVSFC